MGSKFTLLVFGEVDNTVLLFFFPLPRQEGSDGIKSKEKSTSLVLYELEAEEPFLLSPTLTFCFCVRRCM